jgi:hypothetical protein
MEQQSSCYFPLRWESSGDQWWYSSPIDWAAADGHYDIVRRLLHLDPNLLIKLTSLRRIRRLEALWNDDARFAEAARHRASIARNLLTECECRNHQPRRREHAAPGRVRRVGALHGGVGRGHGVRAGAAR